MVFSLLRGTRAWVGTLVVLAGVCTAMANAGSSDTSSPPDPLNTVKAGFLLNFIRFIEWPADSTGAAPQRWEIVVLRDPDLAHRLSEATSGKEIRGHSIRVREEKSLADLLPCHLLYLASEDGPSIQAAVAAAGRKPILTVSDSEQFTRNRGVIRLFVTEDRMRFEINLDAAERSGLRISSKLLNLALVTYEARNDKSR